MPSSQRKLTSTPTLAHTGLNMLNQHTERFCDFYILNSESLKSFLQKLVMETKVLLNILVLYIPLPLFWYDC